MFDETGDEQKSQGWTPLHPRHQRQWQARRLCRAEPAGRPDQGQAHRRGALRHRRKSGRRRGLGLGARLPRLGRPRRSRRQSARDGACRNLRAAAARLRAARHGHRPQRRGLGAAGERPSGELRPQQMQGSLNGPTATGKHCPEGWTLYPFPGPQFAERQRDRQRRGELLHLGRSVQHAWAWARTCRSRPAMPTSRCWRWSTASGSICACHIRWAIYAKWMDGRIDDPNAGWKGRGLWSTYGNRTPFHIEGGKGTTPKVVRFQLRPDPLAR